MCCIIKITTPTLTRYTPNPPSGSCAVSLILLSFALSHFIDSQRCVFRNTRRLPPALMISRDWYAPSLLGMSLSRNSPLPFSLQFRLAESNIKSLHEILEEKDKRKVNRQATNHALSYLSNMPLPLFTRDHFNLRESNSWGSLLCAGPTHIGRGAGTSSRRAVILIKRTKSD